MKDHVEKWNKFRSRLSPEFENNNNNEEHSDEDLPRKDITENKPPTVSIGSNIQKMMHEDCGNTIKTNILENRTCSKRKGSARTYKLNKITNNVRTRADVVIGSGKIS